MSFGRDKFFEVVMVLVLMLSLSALVYSIKQPVNTVEEWNRGFFNSSSADRAFNSGRLGIGYLNGTVSGQPQNTGLNGQNLIGYWRLDESVSGTGGVLNDYSGYRNYVEAQSGVTTGAQGIFSTSAISFSGTGGYLTDNNRLDNSFNQLTVSTWMMSNQRVRGQSSFKGIVVRKPDSTGGFGLLVGQKGVATFRHEELSTKSTESDTAINDGVMHHVVGTWDGSTTRLYVDGQEVASEPATGTISSNTEALYIGLQDPADSKTYLEGNVDETRVYNRSLTQSEVQQLYFNADPFKGSYTSKVIDYNTPVNWSEVNISSTVPTSTSLNLVFQTSDDNFASVKESQTFTASGGNEIFNLNVGSSEDARIVLKGDSTSPSQTWVVENLEVNFFKDFKVNEILNNSNFYENQQLEAKVNISNIEPDSDTVKVEFKAQKYRNDTGWQTFKAENKTFSSNGEDSNILKYAFETDIGPHRIQAEADPGNQIEETNESNNLNSTQFDVPFYGTLYGNTVMNVTVSDSRDDIFYKYHETGRRGTMYFVDSEASFSFSNLEPLADYEALGVADKALNSTGFNDSIQNEWGDGSSIARTECFWISGSDLCNIPVSNSTENSFFDTGIVYDGGSTYTDGDPLLFVSDMADSKQGSLGTYDYEVKVPSTLGETTGNSEKIDVYMEIE